MNRSVCYGLFWRGLLLSVMKVCYDRGSVVSGLLWMVCFEEVCYEGLLQSWFCCEWSVMNGLFRIGQFWKGNVVHLCMDVLAPSSRWIVTEHYSVQTYVGCIILSVMF